MIAGEGESKKRYSRKKNVAGKGEFILAQNWFHGKKEQIIVILVVGQGAAITSVTLQMAATQHHEPAEVLTHVKITPKGLVGFVPMNLMSH